MTTIQRAPTTDDLVRFMAEMKRKVDGLIRKSPDALYYASGVPTNVVDGVFSANGTLLPAPGAGKQYAIYAGECGTATASACSASLQCTIGGNSLTLVRAQLAQQGVKPFDRGGLLLDENTAVTCLWTSGTASFTLAYDIVDVLT